LRFPNFDARYTSEDNSEGTAEDGEDGDDGEAERK